MRAFQRISAPLAALLGAVLSAGPAFAAGPIAQESAEAAIAALTASLEVERDVLKAQQDLYRQTVTDRENASRALQRLLAEFDALVQASPPAPADDLQAKEKEVGEAERLRSGAIQRGRAILDRIQEIQERIAGLERKLGSLKEGLPRSRESLTGTWKVTYLPGLTGGTFVLRQTGTIVQGQYQLDGGWKGSLQGTFVDGKIYLQRIDSKLGRSSELDGYLSGDGTTIRGTWNSYHLADGGAASGSWTATRLDD